MGLPGLSSAAVSYFLFIEKKKNLLQSKCLMYQETPAAREYNALCSQIIYFLAQVEQGVYEQGNNN